MNLRQLIRGVGKFFICVGILLFLFVGYQLWGTGIAEARGQKDLAASFTRRLTPLPTLPGQAVTTETTLPAVELGDAVALIEIPRIGVKKYVVEGVDPEDLKAGPGHYPETPMPGERGNSAIAGHRTTYGAPFYDLNELKNGDPIFVTTSAGRFRYDVIEMLFVDPGAVEVLDPTEDGRLTLTTCHPRFSAAQRLIIVAQLTSPPVDAPPRPQAEPSPDAPPRREVSSGLSGEQIARTPAIIWGAVAFAIWVGGWIFGRTWRRWPAYAITAVPFLLVLFVFYENVARLLPANV